MTGAKTMTDPTTVSYQIPRVQVEQFTQLFSDADFAADIGRTFNCTEAEIVAGMLNALGDGGAARVFLMGHAESDREEDIHYLSEDGELRYREADPDRPGHAAEQDRELTPPGGAT